jgi:lysophospholipase L1-like esterase
MFECLIVGDSIAVGEAMVRKECVSYAVGGWNSWQWNKKFKDKTPLQARTVIISLGSNDHKGVNTEAELLMLRNATQADRVYWILPAIKPNIQEIVKKVARDHGDIVLPITSLQPDKIHPSARGYADIARTTRNWE